MKLFLKIAGVFVLLFAIGFGLKMFGIWEYEFFGKKKEEARREIFEQSQPYVESQRIDAVKLRLEYMTATEEIEKKALKQAIGHKFANFDENKYIDDPDLREFIRSMKYDVELYE